MDALFPDVDTSEAADAAAAGGDDTPEAGVTQETADAAATAEAAEEQK
jgi:hypothetical protein